MRRPGLSVLGLLTLVLLPLAAGCEDPQARIAMLEETNQQLMDQLRAAQGDLATAQRGSQSAADQAAQARADAERLRQQLADAQSAPAGPAAEGWSVVPGGAMIAIEGSVLFPAGNRDLKPEGKTTLDRIASAIQGEYAGKDVYVFGHTDDQPIKKSGWKDNFELSAQRSLSVVRYLESKGIAGSKLVAAGCGEHRPLGANSGDAARSKNRRVEIYAVDPAIKH